MQTQELIAIAQLIRGQRVAALGTLAAGAPYVSMVAYTAEADFGGMLFHLSNLSAHTRHLKADPRCSLLITEAETPTIEDVQTLARITLVGTVALLPRDAPFYAEAQAAYLQRLPAAEMLFSLPGFEMYRMRVSEARYIGGFARAFDLKPSHLQKAAKTKYE
jgi:putative heme iron utilization protein